MAKVAFFCIPAHGHVNAQLALASELVKAGEEVYYYTSPEFETKVNTTGAKAVIVRTSYDEAVRMYAGTLGKNIFSVVRMTYEAGLEIIAKIHGEIGPKNFDYFVVDSFTAYGKVIAMKLEKPYICTVPVFTFTGRLTPVSPWPGFLFSSLVSAISSIPEIIKCYKLAKQFEKFFGHKWEGLYHPFNDYAEMNICMTSRMFQFHDKQFPQEKFRYVGPMMYLPREQADFPMELIKEKKVIYISHGTVYNKDHEFIHECIKAFDNTEYIVVVSSPGFREANEKVIPANFHIFDYVPQLQIMPHVSVFITHGGMNSVNEGLYHGIPLLVTPQAGDQFMNGMRVRDLGAGIYMEKPSAAALLSAVKSLEGENPYRDNARIIGESLKQAGGVSEAVKAVEEFKAKKRISK